MDIYYILENYGIFHLFGPFLIIFSLLYGSLRKVGLFGKVKNAEKFYIVIAFSITFYYIYSISTVEYTQKVLSFFFYEVLVLFFILLILGLIYNSLKSDTKEKARLDILAGLLTLTVIFAFLYASVSYPEEIGIAIENAFSNIFASELFIILVIFGILIIIIIWVTSSGKSSPKEKAKKVLVTTDATLEELLKRISE